MIINILLLLGSCKWHCMLVHYNIEVEQKSELKFSICIYLPFRVKRSKTNASTKLKRTYIYLNVIKGFGRKTYWMLRNNCSKKARGLKDLIALTPFTNSYGDTSKNQRKTLSKQSISLVSPIVSSGSDQFLIY